MASGAPVCSTRRPIGGEQQGLARSAIAALALSANLYFWHFTGGYFDGAAELQPLLHLWSLAVEEQFYLVWPWLLLALQSRVPAGDHARRQRVLALAFGVVFAASFALCIAASWWSAQTAFYLTPTRAWEFAAGALVFVGLDRVGQLRNRTGDALALAGLLGIFVAVAALDRSLGYPGAWALVPVVATMAVLTGTALSPQCLVARLLGWRPLVALGLVSYAWYLWHWPLLTFARVQGLGELRAAPAAAMVVLSLVLAACTYRWLETPVRRRRAASFATRRGTWRVAASGMATAMALAVMLGIWSKWAWHVLPGNEQLARAVVDMRKVRVDCDSAARYRGAQSVGPDCEGGAAAAASGRRMLVWGDSHAAHLVPLLQEFSTQAGSAFSVRYKPQCPPLMGFDHALIGRKAIKGCVDFNRDVLAEITQLREAGKLDAVVLNAHWTEYAVGAAGLTHVQAALTHTLKGLADIGVAAVVLAPSPDMPFEVPACLVRRAEGVCNLDRAVGERQRAAVLSMFREQVRFQRAWLVDPFAALCDSALCPALRLGTVLYSDSHHLTVAGSISLLPVAEPALTTALGLNGSPP
jgi:peptidoglycan/LPS O-acetylase OafA/YrhL